MMMIMLLLISCTKIYLKTGIVYYKVLKFNFILTFMVEGISKTVLTVRRWKSN